MNSNVEALERAIAVAEALQPDVGYDVLLAAAKRFIRNSRGIQPCPSCGLHINGAHFCVGRQSGDKAYPGGSGRPYRDFLSGPGMAPGYAGDSKTVTGGQGGITQHSSPGQAQAPINQPGSHTFSLIEAKTND